MRRTSEFGDLRKKVRAIEINLLPSDLAALIELDEADADDLNNLAAHRNPGQPFVEEAVLQGNGLDLRPDPIWIVGKELAKIGEQRRLAPDALRNTRIDVHGILCVEAGKQLGLVAGPC